MSLHSLFLTEPRGQPPRKLSRNALIYTLLCAAISFAWSGPAPAQDRCSDILRDGIYDTTNRNWEYKLDSFRMRSVCSTSDERMSASAEMVSKAGDPVGFDAAHSKRKTACDKAREHLDLEEIDKTTIKTASDVIVDAWKACMHPESGSRFSLEQTEVPAKIIGHIAFYDHRTPSIPMRGSIEIPSEIDECTCDDPNSGSCTIEHRSGRRPMIQVNLPDKSRATFRCTRKTPDSILMNPNFDVNTFEARLPSVI